MLQINVEFWIFSEIEEHLDFNESYFECNSEENKTLIFHVYCIMHVSIFFFFEQIDKPKQMNTSFSFY